MKNLFNIALIFSLSINLSAQWNSLSLNTDSHIRSVHFIDENNGWVAGLDNFINKTYDGGETWTNTGTTGFSSDRWYSIFAINSYEIYACGSTYNFDRWQENYAFTDNSGNSWEMQMNWGNQTGSWKQVFFLDENYGWKVGIRGGIGRLNKSTTGISGFGSPINVDQSPYAIHFIDQSTGWVAGNNGYIIKSTDGGDTWNEVNSGITESLRSIFFINSSVGWAVGYGDDIGTIIKTTDGGESWSPVNHPPTLSMFSVQFVNENIGWACGSKVENSEERGVILYTNDGGENWSEQYVCDQLSSLYSLFFIDELTGWAVGYDGILLKTTNAGGTTSGVNEDSYFTRSLNIIPNPFSSSTTIEYELNQPEIVRIDFYNCLGEQIDVIEENQQQGLNKILWTPKNLTDGIYYFMIHADEQVASGKIVKVK